MKEYAHGVDHPPYRRATTYPPDARPPHAGQPIPLHRAGATRAQWAGPWAARRKVARP